MNKIYHYFVEGECEEKLINLLKNPKSNCIVPGKVTVYNFINKKISDISLMSLRSNTIIVLVYDTDVENTRILEENIAKLKKYSFNNIYHLYSEKNFEDEIVYSTCINNINDFFKTKTTNDFKNSFINAGSIGLKTKLTNLEFDHKKLWSRQGKGCFEAYSTKEGIRLIKIISK